MGQVRPGPIERRGGEGGEKGKEEKRNHAPKHLVQRLDHAHDKPCLEFLQRHRVQAVAAKANRQVKLALLVSLRVKFLNDAVQSFYVLKNLAVSFAQFS